jgi:hypothetical protein
MIKTVFNDLQVNLIKIIYLSIKIYFINENRDS